MTQRAPARTPALRSILLRLHRWMGLALAAFLACAGLTGSVIVFDDALDAWLNPDLFYAPADTAGQAELPPQALVDRIEAQRPDAQVRYIVDRPPPGRSVVAFVGPRGDAKLAEDELFADPATGRLLGGRLYAQCYVSRRALIPFIYRIHDSLALGPFGQWVMGIVAILWMLDCINGFLLTLPPHLATQHRGLTWKQWRVAWTISIHRGGIRRIFDLHRAVSLWLWLVLFGVAMSGVSLALPRVFEAVVTHALPTGDMQRRQLRPPPSQTPGASSLDQLEAIAMTAAQAQGWRGGMPMALFRFGGTTTFYFSQDGSVRGAGMGAWHVSLDTAGVATVHRPTDGRAGDLVQALQMPWHNGRLIGLPGRILICLSGVATAMLSVTGVLIWWRKRQARVAMARRRAREKSFFLERKNQRTSFRSTVRGGLTPGGADSGAARSRSPRPN